MPSNHQIAAKRIKLNLLFKLSYLNSNSALIPAYINLALNNGALGTTTQPTSRAVAAIEKLLDLPGVYQPETRIPVKNWTAEVIIITVSLITNLNTLL